MVEILGTAAVSSLFTGILATIVADRRRRSLSMLEPKRSVLFRVVGYRHALGAGSPTESERNGLLPALNEACMVFAKDKPVVAELKRMMALQDKTEGLLPLIKAMAKAAKVPVQVDDDFLRTPFNRSR